MAMNSAEIQYILDRRGVVEIESGSSITTPIQLAHLTNRAIIKCPGDITYNGPPGRWAFEWKWQSTYAHSPCSLTFSDIEFDRNNVANGGFLKVFAGGNCPKSLTMRNATLDSEEAHCVDANGVAYIDSVHLYDMRSVGSGAIRWCGASADACGWFKIKNWRHLGVARVGASFSFKNLRNLIRVRLIDEGDPDLLESLKTNYVGAISSQETNCSGYNVLDDLWSEPWGSWASACPGCWGFEVRADEVSGSYRQHYSKYKNVTANAGGIEAGVELFQFYGGDTSTNASSLRVDVDDTFQLYEEKTLFAGRSMAVANRPMKNGGAYDANDIAKFDDANADSFRDYWVSALYKIPFQEVADSITYVGSDNETNYTTRPDEYDA